MGVWVGGSCDLVLSPNHTEVVDPLTTSSLGRTKADLKGLLFMAMRTAPSLLFQSTLEHISAWLLATAQVTVLGGTLKPHSAVC